VLRQPPGSENPLGKVKFVIPNNYRIYLHDTPHRSLFSRQERTFSSGCIRLEKPIELAGYLLDQEPDAMPGLLQKYLSETRTVSLKLKQSWPIYLVYWTAWADEDGLVQFRDDVYNRDTLLIAGLIPQQKQVVGAAEQKRAVEN
jgi:murein L,D-transpeptidase YcbB/YkuD